MTDPDRRGRPAGHLRSHGHDHDHAGHAHRGRTYALDDGGDRFQATPQGTRFAPAPEFAPGPSSGPATVSLSPSLLRMSVWTRLAVAASAAALVWAMTLSVVG